MSGSFSNTTLGTLSCPRSAESIAPVGPPPQIITVVVSHGSKSWDMMSWEMLISGFVKLTSTPFVDL